MPFFDGDAAYIYFDNEWTQLHGGEFGAGVGQFLVSPGRDVVIAERMFEGGATSGILIDLKTGKSRKWAIGLNDPNIIGWSKESWRTSLEAMPREQVYMELASPNMDKVQVAMNELAARQYIDADWRAMAEIVADTNAPASARIYLVITMVYTRQTLVDRVNRDTHFGTTTMPTVKPTTKFDYSWPPPVYWAPEIIDLFEKTKDDPNPEIRKRVREALDEMRAKPA